MMQGGAPAASEGKVQEERVVDSPYLGREERLLLEQGKAEHRETTAAARRALQVAERTSELAQGTVVELHRQGEQLERAELGMQRVGQEVREASALLRFMRRWCCFQCCDCCDPTLDQDLTRGKRVATARQEMAAQRQNLALQYGAKQQSAWRKAQEHDPAYGGDEGRARHELLAEAQSVRERHQAAPPVTGIGMGLPESDRLEIRRETEQQDELIVRIGGAVESLHAMSKEMHDELAEQQPRIKRLQDSTAVAHDQLGSLTRQAHRL